MSKENVIYVLGFKEIPDRLKIEYTDDFDARISYLDNQMPYDLIVYYKRYTPVAEITEYVVHDIFKKSRVSSNINWFNINKSIVIEEINDVITFFEQKYDEKE
jgi:hypothetical protein